MNFSDPYTLTFADLMQVVQSSLLLCIVLVIGFAQLFKS